MKFRTEISLGRPEGVIDHSTKITLIGSCFSDEIGERLRCGLFDVSVNPLGTLYNPLSIAEEVVAALDGREFTSADIFEAEGRHHTFRRHSSFSSTDPEQMLLDLNSHLRDTAQRLATTDLLIITLGSAIAFIHKQSRSVVANCHKRPADEFDRIIIDVNSVTAALGRMLDSLRVVNPAVKVILTVSPVRHAGYGLELDRLSKSTLIVAAHTLCATQPSTRYFPSYEMLVDDLRDYRFYAPDMAHPSAMAVDYIYDNFSTLFINPASAQIAAKATALGRSMLHRASSPEASETLRSATRQKLNLLAHANSMPQLVERFNTLYP